MNAVIDVFQDTYLPDILHAVSQTLLIPTLAAIIAMLLITLFLIGQIIVERCTVFKRRHTDMEKLVNMLHESSWEKVPDVVAQSELLNTQKEVLLLIARNRSLPEEALFALADLEVGGIRKRYTSKLAWTDTLAKIAPLLGLMGTLIPLGPGIVALGQKDVALLSQSLLVAFDATVCGLICSILCLIMSKIRSRWYSESISTLKSLVDCLLEKAVQSRALSDSENKMIDGAEG